MYSPRAVRGVIGLEGSSPPAPLKNSKVTLAAPVGGCTDRGLNKCTDKLTLAPDRTITRARARVLGQPTDVAVERPAGAARTTGMVAEGPRTDGGLTLASTGSFSVTSWPGDVKIALTGGLRSAMADAILVLESSVG